MAQNSAGPQVGGVALVDREKRERCWAARDAYHACLVAAPSGSGGQVEGKLCSPALELYAAACPRSWLLHFEKRRKVEEERRAREAAHTVLRGGA